MNKIRKKIGAAIGYFSYISIATCFFIMILTTSDVVLRKINVANITGSYEMIEMSMVLMVYLGIASLQVKDGHIRVDMLLTVFPRRIQNFLLSIMLMIEVFIYGLMTYACIVRVIELQKTRLYTGVLKLPYTPFYIVMIIGLASFTLLLFADSLIKLLQGLGLESEEEPTGQTAKLDAISKSAE